MSVILEKDVIANEQSKHSVFLMVQVIKIDKRNLLDFILNRPPKESTHIIKHMIFKGSFDTRNQARQFIADNLEVDQVWSIIPTLQWQQ